MKQSFKVSQCQLRARERTTNKNQKKKKNTTFNKQTCWSSVYATTCYMSCSTLHSFTWHRFYLFVSSDSLWNTLFFTGHSDDPFRAALAEAGGGWEKTFFLPLFCVTHPFLLFPTQITLGGGEKPGHATTTGKPNRQLGYPGQLKPWFAGIRYDPRQLMKRSKKGQINIKQIQFKSARDTGKFFIDILSHLFEIYVL